MTQARRASLSQEQSPSIVRWVLRRSQKPPETPCSGNFSRDRQTFIYLDICASAPHPAPMHRV